MSPFRGARLEKAVHMTAALPSIAKIAELLGGDVQGAEVLFVLALGTVPKIVACRSNLSRRIAKGFVTHSFAGDDWKACRDHVRTKLGLPDPKLEPKNGKAEWTVLDEYIYYDQNGERYLKVRKCRDSNGKKQFPQYHWDGHGWSKGKPD